jgi:integrase
VRQLSEGHDGRHCLSLLKTKASRRTLQLPELAARVLKAWHDRPGNGRRSAFVFTDREGNPLRKSNFVRRDYKPLLRRAGLPDVDFHSLRHSSNSLLIEEGADPILVARRNGHASTRMVLDRYGHLFEGARRQAAETMDRIFAGVEIGRQMVVKKESPRTNASTAIPKSLIWKGGCQAFFFPFS